MRWTAAGVTILMGMAGPAAAAQAALKTGDPAPPLGRRIEWLKGSPVDLSKGAGEIFVLEFWATWCGPCVVQIPHITELQGKFRKHKVRFVALTSPGWQRQRLADVKRFVQAQGDKMGYTVGFDPADDSQNNYMAAAGVTGIPYAFIVGRDGKVAWQGYPDDQLEHILEQIVAGKFDLASAVAAAEQRKKLDTHAMQFNRAASGRQWEEALGALSAMLDIDPANEFGIRFSLQIINSELKDRKRARDWVQAYLGKHKGSAAGLARVASTLMESPQLADRHPDLTLAVAAAACAADGDSAAALQAHARALHQVGRIDRAIEMQEKAVAAANGTQKGDAAAALEFYRACKQLAESPS